MRVNEDLVVLTERERCLLMIHKQLGSLLVLRFGHIHDANQVQEAVVRHPTIDWLEKYGRPDQGRWYGVNDPRNTGLFSIITDKR